MWHQVRTGKSGAEVWRGPGVFRKTGDPASADDLVGEGARLVWLRDQGLPAPEVLECGPGLLVTRTVPGREGSGEWAAGDRDRVVDALAEVTRALHALPIEDCPFDRRLALTVPEALARELTAAELADVDPERLGWTQEQLRAELLATRPAAEDLVVCHGDLCLPNVLLDPASCAVTGLIDAPRLGVADRWVDLAIATRSLASPKNPGFGEPAAERFLAAYAVELDAPKRDFYRLLDEFC